MMKELKRLDGASFYIMPHAVLGIEPAEASLSGGAPSSRLLMTVGIIEVSGSIEDVRATLFPPKLAAEDEPDDVQIFMDSCTIRAEGQSISARDLFEAYSEWCQQNAFGYPSQTDFARSLRKMGIQSEAGRVRMYAGINLGPGMPRRPDRKR